MDFGIVCGLSFKWDNRTGIDCFITHTQTAIAIHPFTQEIFVVGDSLASSETKRFLYKINATAWGNCSCLVFLMRSSIKNQYILSERNFYSISRCRNSNILLLVSRQYFYTKWLLNDHHNKFRLLFTLDCKYSNWSNNSCRYKR